MAKSTVKVIASILMIIGALNWGILGVTSTNVAESVLGVGTITTIVYVLVGLAGLLELVNLFKKK